MVKSIDFIDESIFNCLGADDYAVFMATTGLCDGIRLNDGVVWVQYNNNNEITLRRRSSSSPMRSSSR